ncbi:MAG: hypothetical protein K0S65_6369 [Labilithrix sp.]|nr:hypothetical protein [Labilithrix sp.]
MNSRMQWLLGILLILVCASGIGIVQPSLATRFKEHARRDDFLALPPPAQLRAMTVGYRTASADLLWAKLVVEHGLHWEERRAFPDMPTYIDGILALDPDHPMLYDFVDTLLLFTPKGGAEADARMARSYFERGTREHPFDARIWLRYGEFLAYLAPSFLKDPNEADAWRRDGALAIVRAVDLGADADRGLAAASILTKAGDLKANIAHLQRMYALTDDPDTRLQIRAKLEKLKATVEAEAPMSVVEDQWRTRFPFVSRGSALLLGPYRDPAACAGPSSSRSRGCPRDWSNAVGEAR